MHKDFIYLASASPRRRELLAQIGVEFTVRPARVPEAPVAGEGAEPYVLRVAKAKAAAVWGAVAAAEPRPVLAADTAVVVDEDVLGKPGSREQALAMLDRLSNRSHEVLTAVIVRYGERIDSAVNRSKVRFRDTTRLEREAYCDSREPFDKAGGYAIQGMGALFIADLDGSYSGVMGLPLYETAKLLSRYRMPQWLYAPGSAP